MEMLATCFSRRFIPSILVGLSLLFALPAFSQTDTEFWFAAPDVNVMHADRPIFLRITCMNQASVVTISEPANPLFPVLTYTLAPYSTQSVDLTPYIDMIETAPVSTPVNYGLKITATSSITAYYEVVTTCNCNPEIFALKGRNSLGTNFLTPFQTYLPSVQPIYLSGFVIVATENNTTITITPSVPAIGHPANVPFIITLNKGQTYSVMAVGSAANQRLAGSTVVSDKSIAITLFDDSVSGSAFSGTCADLCGDQLVPVDIIGKEYIVIRGWITGGIEKVFILGTVNNTQIFINGSTSAIATINKGQTYMYSLNANSVYIQADKPVYLIHLSGFGCELGLPVLPPIHCTGSKTVGFTRSVGDFFGIILLTKTGSEGAFQLNGNSSLIQASDFSPVPGTNGEWLAARVDLNASCPVGVGSLITNSVSSFHLGTFNGANTHGCRYGYFSNYSNLYLGSDIAKCPLDTVKLDAGYGKDSYLWSTGDTTQSITINAPGTYWVKAGFGECEVSDTIVITNKYLALPDLGNDTAICAGNSFTFGPDTTFSTYLWSTNEMTSQITVHESGTYSLTVSDNVCIDTTSRKVIFMNANIVNNDTLLCEGQSITLSAFVSGTDTSEITYHWSTGDTTAIIHVVPTTTTVYSVTVSCMNTICTDQIEVSFVQGGINLGPDLDTCTGYTFTLNGPSGFPGYHWSSGAETQMITASQAGQYWLEVTTTQGCTFRDTIQVFYKPLPVDIGQAIMPSHNGLVAWYPLNSNVLDSCSYFNNGVSHGMSFTTDRNGNPGKAALFNGTNYFSVSNSASLQSPQSGITIAGWVKLDNLSNGSILCKTDQQSVSPFQYRVGFQGSTAYLGFKNSASSYVDVFSSLTLPLNQWKFTGFTYDGQYVRYYIGENLAAQVAQAGSIFPDTKNLEIGRDAFGTIDYFRGAMDDIQIFNRSLCKYELNLITSPRILGLTASSQNICAADSTVITIHNPQPGISYQLYTVPGNIASGSPQVTYCDSIIKFSTGVLYSNTHYKILARDITYGCERWLYATIDINVKPVPVVTISPSNPVICQGDSITLTASSSLPLTNYSWNPGLSTSSIIVKPLFDSIITLVGNLNGCIDSTDVTVIVHPRPQVVISPSDTVICNGSSVLLVASTGLSGTSYSWSNGIYTSSNSVLPTVTTIYTVTATLNNCTDTAKRKVIVKPIPVISFTPVLPAICKGQQLTMQAHSDLSNPQWQWLNGPSTSTYTLVPSQSAYYFVQCTVNNCTSSDSMYVTVNPQPVVSISPQNPEICVGDQMTLYANSTQTGTVFTWNSGFSGSSIMVAPLVNSNYSVQGVLGSCKDSDTVGVIVKPRPFAYVVPADTTICNGDSFMMIASSNIPGSLYSWNTGVASSSINLSPQVSTQYHVIVTADGCKDTAFASVKVIDSPVIELGSDDFLCEGNSFTLSVSEGYSSYFWSDGSHGSSIVAYNPGIYWVVVKEQQCETTDTIMMKDCSELWIPNAFTPDGSGINDYFLPKGVEVHQYEMLIFNRWGEQLFTSNDINHGWDGRYKNVYCPSDVYYYLIRFTGIGRPGSDKQQVRHGTFTLIR